MYPDDTEELREKLKDYYGTAVAEGMPMASHRSCQVENMSDEEVRKEAKKESHRNSHSVPGRGVQMISKETMQKIIDEEAEKASAGSGYDAESLIEHMRNHDSVWK